MEYIKAYAAFVIMFLLAGLALLTVMGLFDLYRSPRFRSLVKNMWEKVKYHARLLVAKGKDRLAQERS